MKILRPSALSALLIPLLLVFSTPAAGESLSEQLIVENYSTAHGLPSNTIYSSLKDRDGFMWFGTWYGLCRFDGTKFQTYNQKTKQGSDIPPRKIQSVAEDSNSNLWLMTADLKLYVFYRETEVFHSVYEEIKPFSNNLQIIKIQPTADGNMLLLTKDKILLLAGTNKDGNIWLRMLFDSRGKINPYSFHLNKNVLSETKDNLSWIDKDFNLISIAKGTALRSLPEDYVSKYIASDRQLVCASSNGRMMYVGDDGGNIFIIDADGGHIHKLSLQEQSAVRIIQTDRIGNIYAITDRGSVYECKKGSDEPRRLSFSLNSHRATHMLCDTYDRLWIYERGASLICYDTQNQQHQRYQLTYKDDFMPELCMKENGEQGLFFLTPAGEALFFDRSSNTMRSISEETKHPENTKELHFSHIYMDRDGLVWLSSTNDGIYRLNFPKQQFGIQPLPNNDLSGVRCIFQMHNGNILVGSRSRDVYIYSPDGSRVEVLPYNKYHIGAVYYAMEDNKGNLWLSTKGDGLVRMSFDEQSPGNYHIERFKNDIDNPESVSGNNVYVTCIDGKGNFWVGTLDGGLNLMTEQDGKTIFYNKNNGFSNYPAYGLYTEIRNMVEDEQGRLWIGTIDGLMSVETTFANAADIKFETYRQPGHTTFANSDIYTLYKDRQQQIWVGAFGGGLSRITGYDESSKTPLFQSLSGADGLRNDIIRSMVEDFSGRIWFATEAGLSCYDRKTGRVRNFDRYDGLPQVKMEEMSAMLSRDGRIWMGSQTGLLVFDPEKVQVNTADYRTFIVDCTVNNRPLSDDTLASRRSMCFTDELQLNYDEEILTLEFSALNYKNHGNVTYRYRLEGYENEWHYNGTNRIASYTNLPPGSYTFRVETIDGFNPTLQSAAKLHITVLPPWWTSWWAKLIYFLLGVAVFYGAMRLTLFILRMRNDVYIGQRLAELKIKFFTNISHELRTPLTLIQGSIQELKAEQAISERGAQYLAMMEKNSSQMIQLVNQILDFRKIQNGKMRLHVAQTDVNDVLRQLHREFHLLAQEQEISFDIQPSESPVYVWADRHRLETVVRNIIANAFKFTPSGGSIYSSVGLLTDNSGIYIRVEDSGCGIPEGKQDDIFERFSQAENAKQSQYQGTGIGLALSRDIIELHHGRIYASNADGGGAVFVVELLFGKDHFKEGEVDFYEGTEMPQGEEQPEPVQDTVSKPHDSGRQTLLVVDDNKDLCRMLTMQLEQIYNIYTAHDGSEALKKINLYHPDVVITDQMMPVMDGLQLLSHIREDFKISHIPVIILTAKGDEQAKTKAISMGANAYITKPFSKDYLLARIDQLLKARSTFRSHLLAAGEPQSENDDYSRYLEQRDVEFIDSIHTVIEQNLQNVDFNIDTIAATLGLSRSAFFKKVKSLTGFAPVDLIKEFRLSKSAELLATTDLSMTEVAYKVGFRDSGYFSKCFRKRYGQSPREYAQAKRGI